VVTTLPKSGRYLVLVCCGYRISRGNQTAVAIPTFNHGEANNDAI
jgi:hypothetical protein